MVSGCCWVPTRAQMERSSVWFPWQQESHLFCSESLPLPGSINCRSHLSLRWGSWLVGVPFWGSCKLQSWVLWLDNCASKRGRRVWPWVTFTSLVHGEPYYSAVRLRKCYWAFCVSFGILSTPPHTHTQEYYMPLRKIHWKIRGCRNLSVCGCSLHRVWCLR